MTARTFLAAVGIPVAPNAKHILKHPVQGATEYAAYRAARKSGPRRMAKLLAALGAVTATAAATPFALKALRARRPEVRDKMPRNKKK